MRIFPPSEINYPDLKNDDDFFEKIGMPQLRIKYPNAEERKFLEMDRMAMKVALKVTKNETESKYAYLHELMLVHRRPTTRRLVWDILDKMDWKVWEMYPEQIGLHKTDPRKCVYDMSRAILRKGPATTLPERSLEQNMALLKSLKIEKK